MLSLTIVVGSAANTECEEVEKINDGKSQRSENLMSDMDKDED